MNNRVYAVRDTETGELVNNITSPQHRFWEVKGWAERAVEQYNNRRVKWKHGRLEVVTFELVEVKTDEASQ